MINLKDKLIEKSIEAFVMGLEIYNKPTIKYRIEGFSFFIVNAWELMLKAELLNRGESIYYKDDSTRTITATNALHKIYTNKYTMVRLNLEKIIDLRNISTHYITEDYEVKYAPLFQACVINYTTEMLRFHGVDITEYIPQNFLTLSVRYEPLSNEQIKVKYSAEIAEKLINHANEIDVLSQEYDSEKFSINMKQVLYITKKKDESDFTVRIDKSSTTPINIVKELKDPSDTHKYSYQNVIAVVKQRLIKHGIKFNYKRGFNQHVLNLIMEFYHIKQNKLFAYEHVIGNNHSYTYSEQLIDFIIEEIKKNPQKFVESLKHKTR